MSRPNTSLSYSGDGHEIFSLALKTGLLTILTGGIYRFWQKTRIRKYIWTSTQLGEDRFEYTGTGVEKLLGFLIAVIVLAIYLGLFQMLLFFLGVNILTEPQTEAEVIAQIGAFYSSLLAVVPLVFYAQYRARRYKLARTRWRGIRFGMDKGAWGYVLRALGYYLLVGLTLGALLPLATFRLEKYMADRSYFGSAKFEQGGAWTKLYKAMTHVGIGILIIVASGAAILVESISGSVAAIMIGYVWLLFGFAHYRVQSFAYLTSHKTLDEIGFTAKPQTSTVVFTYIGGSLIIGLVIAILGAIITFAFMDMFVGLAAQSNELVPLILGGVAYIAILIATQALGLAVITQPILRHYMETLTVDNAEALDQVRQRASELGVDGEGFADALDIGTAI